MEQHTITASPAELSALIEIIQRAPMTLGERLFADRLIDRWYQQLTTAPLMSEHTGVPQPPATAPDAPETAQTNGVMS